MKKFIVILIAFILLPVVINESKFTNNADTIKTECGVERRDAIPVIASKENPFYALIATPVALFYDNEMHVEPLLIKNISNPSSSIKRFE
ncbi:MAG TPA: hypothetical protein ENI53_02930, partial [Thermoplasmatales archaeon]|nr:hypothetical protein [Thermoplasmatales archaeon]